MSWDRATYTARIRHPGQRHAAASPDPSEVEAYLAAVSAGTGELKGRLVVVLGATPELRCAVVAAGATVVAVDRSDDAWSLLGPWVESERELKVRGSWFSLDRLLTRPVDAVVGDGIIGNMADLGTAVGLLRGLRSLLAPGGCVVMRNVFVPDDLDPREVRADRLLAAHRAGHLDAAELGFGLRLVGHLERHWDRASGLLDGAALYAEVDGWQPEPPLTGAERAAVARYVFRGTNLVPTEGAWRAAVAEASFALEPCPLVGRHWYRYYQVQRLRPSGSGV
ncbi:MAG: hypothetical protein ACR2JF_08870 [Iamia sp.]